MTKPAVARAAQAVLEAKHRDTGRLFTNTWWILQPEDDLGPSIMFSMLDALLVPIETYYVPSWPEYLRDWRLTVRNYDPARNYPTVSGRQSRNPLHLIDCLPTDVALVRLIYGRTFAGKLYLNYFFSYPPPAGYYDPIYYTWSDDYNNDVWDPLFAGWQTNLGYWGASIGVLSRKHNDIAPFFDHEYSFIPGTRAGRRWGRGRRRPAPGLPQTL